MAPGNFSIWFNLKAAFIEIFCPIEMICNIKQMVIKFKQEEWHMVLEIGLSCISFIEDYLKPLESFWIRNVKVLL